MKQNFILVTKLPLCTVFFFLVVVLGCDPENSTGVSRNRPQKKVWGSVTDSASSVGLANVLIATQVGPDSLVFVGDSIAQSNSNYSLYLNETHSGSNGSYSIPYAKKNSEIMVEKFFAFLTGYKVWKYSAVRDTLVFLYGDTDWVELNIRMVKK